MTHRLSFLFISLCLLGLVSFAGPSDDYNRIARISGLDGHVSFQHANDVDWSAASINLPLQPGDRIYTGTDGRAEIEFDEGSVYRLAEKTDVEILSLKEDLIQIQILLGLSTLTVSSGVNFEVDAPAAAFNPLRKGVYRFDVAENGDSDAIVRKGLLEGANDWFSRQAEAGELLHVTPGEKGTNELSRYDRRDDWDEWNDRRNADMYADTSRKYLPEDIYMGVSELDQYGRWVTVSPYGPAWVPLHVDSYWSPYWEGRWCYRPFWGWTWVSYEPWGWLPYHYGRWYFSAGIGWCWLPGPAFTFNFWSPGLVSFYRGPGWVSWCALGPGDYYNLDNYYFNSDYNYQLNKLRVLQTRTPGDLLNRNIPGAFRTVQDQQFTGERFGGRSRIAELRSIAQPWNQGELVNERLSIKPTSQSFNPAPDRTAAGPAVTSALPAVIRTEPESRSGTQGRFTRITNSNVRSLPFIRTQERTEPGAVNTGRGMESGIAVTPGISSGRESGGRAADTGNPGTSIWNRRAPEAQSGDSPAAGSAYQTPQAVHPSNLGVRDASRDTPGASGPGDRPPVSPRASQPLPNPGSSIGGSGNRGREAPATPRRQESVSPAATPSYERPASEKRAAPQQPRSDDRPRPSNSAQIFAGATSSGFRDYGSSPSLEGERSPAIGSGQVYSAPQQAAPSWGVERNASPSWDRSRVFVAPGVSRSGWYGGPSFAGSGGAFFGGSGSGIWSTPQQRSSFGSSGIARHRR